MKNRNSGKTKKLKKTYSKKGLFRPYIAIIIIIVRHLVSIISLLLRVLTSPRIESLFLGERYSPYIRVGGEFECKYKRQFFHHTHFYTTVSDSWIKFAIPMVMQIGMLNKKCKKSKVECYQRYFKNMQYEEGFFKFKTNTNINAENMYRNLYRYNSGLPTQKHIMHSLCQGLYKMNN